MDSGGQREAAGEGRGGDPEEQRKVKKSVAFLGPVASYTHQAAKTTFPEDEYELVPVVTIRDIFDVVQAGRAAYGVVPFENSTHGPVTFTLDSLADRDSAYADLCVCGEVYLEVHHYLLGRLRPEAGEVKKAERGGEREGKGEEEGETVPAAVPAPALALASALAPSTGGLKPPAAAAGGGSSSSPGGTGGTCTPTAAQPNPPRPRARPLASLAHVARVYSHPQAFGQTAAFLGAFLRGVDAVDVSSTSRAAELAAADGTGASAAIASALAAEVSGLDVLARCIEDREDNTTRFFVLHRGVPARGEWGFGGPEGEGEEEEGASEEGREGEGAGKETEAPATEARKRTKTLVSFTVPHRSPGALADVLECFRRAGLNLTSINSVPSLERPFQYLFFVECEGSRLDDGDGRVAGALAGVAAVAQSWRWLGSWESRRVEGE